MASEKPRKIDDFTRSAREGSLKMQKILEKIEKAEIYILPVEKLEPNPWNPNEMGETAYRALGESIRRYGIHIQPLVVRPVGEKFQIIDGYHRYCWADEMGLPAVSAVVVEVSDFDAKKLTQILNRTRGEDNPVFLKKLLDSLLAEGTPDEVIEGLPFASEGELNHVLEDLEKQITSDFATKEGSENPENSDSEKDTEKKHRCPACGFEFS